MQQDRDALLAHYRSMRAGLLAAVDGLNDAQLGEASLDGWAVKDHLIHIALWDEIRAAELQRISAGFESLWKMSHEHESAFGPLGYELRRTATAAQALWELSQTHEALLAAISSATLRGLDASLYGEAGLPSSHETMHAFWIQRWRAERGF